MINKIKSKIPTPCYVIDEKKLIENLELLNSIEKRSGCKILLAQKAFSAFSLYPLIGQYISGTAASGLFEALLGFREMGKENHIFSPAYPEKDMDQIIKICDHIVFNSFSQWNKHKDKIMKTDNAPKCGIRINPEYSEIETDIYNPCFRGSRMGVTLQNFDDSSLEGITGLHFHTMCEQNSDTLERTVKIVDEKFGRYLKNMKWINLGGGHHITRSDYDVETLLKCIDFFQSKYGLEVYLEPGEAIALNAGYLVSTVLDTIKNGIDIVILDASAACHMPDVLEMPYRPEIIGSDMPDKKKFTYRLGGNTCLAGDVIGDYSFDSALVPGTKLVFCDMAIYSMVKNNTFNGMPLPSIGILRKNGEFEIIRQFGYDDFRNRLS